MSALSDLYRDESETEGDDEERGADPSEEETLEIDFGEDDHSEEEPSHDDEDESDSGRPPEEESERSESDNSGRPRDESESEQHDNDDDNEESDRFQDEDEESDSNRAAKEESESEPERHEEEEESDSGYGKDDDDSDTRDDDAPVNDDDDEYDSERYDDDPENFKDEPEKAPRGLPMDSGGMSSAQKTCFFCGCLICMIIALVGGAVIGALLTDEDTSFKEVLGIETDQVECRDLDIPEPTSVFTCPEDNVPLEFRIVFDADPADVGLRVIDPFGISMWNFGTGSFGSFALLLRENIFTLCLSPFQNYTFELTDTAENGFISTFGQGTFGTFSLIYADKLVTSYNGDCEAENSLECGAFCKCEYLLAVNASSGSCTTECGTTAAPVSNPTSTPTGMPTPPSNNTTAMTTAPTVAPTGNSSLTTSAPTGAVNGTLV